jgi:hypothetical protein
MNAHRFAWVFRLHKRSWRKCTDDCDLYDRQVGIAMRCGSMKRRARSSLHRSLGSCMALRSTFVWSFSFGRAFAPQNLSRMRPHDLPQLRERFSSPPVSIRRSSRKSSGTSSVQLTLDTYSHLLPDLVEFVRGCVSRVGIEPERRGRRPKPERLRITGRNHGERGETW